ncbi:MAG: PEGA domain-containing protein [Planctomycetes bacterium]|nr:PEGA domain-containing protein [Planctomycetota bacterium]
MAVQIVISEQSGRKRTVALKEGQEVSIGRGTGSDIMLTDYQVSRVHCTVRWDRDGIRIEDHGTRNGTRVNSKPITGSRTLKDGDVIGIGKCSIRLITLGPEGVAARGGTSRKLIIVCAVAALFAIGIAAGLFSDQIADLLVGTPPPEVQPTPHLTVRSKPAGATVFLDNQYAGVTPVKLLPDGGPHSIRLVLSGYGSHSQAVEMGGKPRKIDVELLPVEQGVIEITSQPSDAEVILDGDKIGLSPIRIGAAPGTYEILIQKTNYIAWKNTVQLAPGQTLKVVGTMENRLITSFLKTLKENPHDVSAYCQLAHYYILERRHEEACDALRSAMGAFAQGKDTSGYGGLMKALLDKIYFEDYFDVGNPQQHAKMQEWIIALYSEMIEKYPNNNLKKWLAGILARAGRKTELKVVLEEGKPGPDLALYFRAAEIYLDKRKYPRAIGILNKAINLGPKNFEARLKLGEAYLQWCKNGKPEVKKHAVKNLEIALKLCKDPKQRKKILALRAEAAKL